MQDGQDIAAFHPDHPFFIRNNPIPNDLNLDGQDFSDVPNFSMKFVRFRPKPRRDSTYQTRATPGGWGAVTVRHLRQPPAQLLRIYGALTLTRYTC